MISDEPDEDADALDDEAALETVLDDHPPRQDPHAAAATTFADWPLTTTREIGLDLDAETLTWFKATHSDWRRAIRFVLRAWVAAQAKEQRTVQTLMLPAPPSVDDRPLDRP